MKQFVLLNMLLQEYEDCVGKINDELASTAKCAL